MKFNEKYIKDMKKMRAFSNITMIVGIIICSTLFITTLAWIVYFTEGVKEMKGHELLLALIELGSLIAYSALIIYESKVKKRIKEPGNPYILNLNNNISYDTLCTSLKNHPSLFNCYINGESSVYKTSSKGDLFKYFIFKMDEYNKTEFKRIFNDLNEKYKKECHEKETHSDDNRRARFIFIFVDNWSKDADQLVHYFQKDLQRVEMSMTYIIYNHKIYISPIYCDFVNDGAYRLLNKKAKIILDMVD